MPVFRQLPTSGRAGAAVIPGPQFDHGSKKGALSSVGGLLSDANPKLGTLFAWSALPLHADIGYMGGKGPARVHEPLGDAPTKAGQRWLHAGALMSDGNPLIHGGLDESNKVLGDTWYLNGTYVGMPPQYIGERWIPCRSTLRTGC